MVSKAQSEIRMKILHVASFKGNIGDIANHYGFRSWFEAFFEDAVEWLEFEIRDVYRNIVGFDDCFVELANRADLVVIGGGNFFELWVDKSPTGTSISIEKQYLDKILTPIFFNALGVDDGMGVSSITVDKFNIFFRRLIASDQFLVSVRNDGALETLKEHINNTALLQKIISIPDGGFFANFRKDNQKFDQEFPVIGINLAGDMLDTRFPGNYGMHAYESFQDEFVVLMEKIWHQWPTVKFVMFPHIYSDMKIYANLLDVLPDALRRNQVRVAAYDANLPAIDTIFSEYMACTVILGMRFHANVVALANGIPSVGLYSYKQIQSLFCEIGIEKYLVDVRKPGFNQEIQHLLRKIIEDKHEVNMDLLKVKLDIEASRNRAGEVIFNWLLHHGFKANNHGSVL